MLYSILLIVAMIVIFRFYKKKSHGLPAEKKKKLLRTWLIAAAAVAVAVLAFAKGNVIAGAIASLVAIVSRALPLLRFAPLLKNLFSQQASAENQQDHQQGKQKGSSAIVSPAMDKAEAADILGVPINASEEEIITAHKRLIQKVHPDKGGSDALARQINAAKKTLLEEHP